MPSNGPPTRFEHDDLKDRVKALETWNTRLTFAIIGVFFLAIGSVLTNIFSSVL